MGIKLSIKSKIAGLIGVSLAVSLASYIGIGTNLLIKDKISYIYDQNLTKLEAVAESVEGQIQRVLSAGNVLSTLKDPEHGFNAHGRQVGMQGALILTPTSPTTFAKRARIGPKAAAAESALSQLGWTPAIYEKSAFLIGPAFDGLIPIGGRVTDSDGSPVAFLALVEFTSQILKNELTSAIRLFDTHGSLILQNAGETSVNSEGLHPLQKEIIQAEVASGVRDWEDGGTEFIVAYWKLAQNKLVLFSVVPKAVAFEAANSLTKRSLFLGISILLFSLGLALLMAKGLTARIRQLWFATQKVTEGDFSVRIDMKKAAQDEVNDLASSFNVMASKIDELMVQTAEKARMEKELETAQAFQGWFFPKTQFEDKNANLSGQYIPASECAGDWWHYAKIGDHLIATVGDATGHGVSAALVTAAAHGAFCMMVKQFEATPERKPMVKEIVAFLNEAVSGAAGGDASITLIASVVNLNTGVMEYVNASHTTPYLYRKDPDASNPVANFKPLIDGKCTALGYPKEEYKPAVVQLQPGDRILWYSDGLLDCKNEKGQALNKRKLLSLLSGLIEKHPDQSSPVSEELMSEFMKFLGGASNDRCDDITVVVFAIPASAQLANSGPESPEQERQDRQISAA